MPQKNICYIANQGQHYRFPIFKAMGEQLGIEFYLGDQLQTPIKPFDYNALKGYKKTLKNHYFGKFYWQSGVIRLLFKNYNTYLFTGEPFCLSTWVFLLLAKFKKCQTISWTHGWYGRESRVKVWIKKAYFSLFTDILVYGEYAIRLMTEAGIPAEKMRCIANSLDSERNMTIRKTVKESSVYTDHFANSNPVLIYCGRIQQIKRIDMIIDAMKVLKQEGHPVNLMLIGKDVDGVGLGKYAMQTGLKDNIWFFGPCYDDEMLANFFYQADVCVSPGNIGLTAVHCLSFGCPAITHSNFSHQMPEFEAIRPGVTGDFFE